MIVVLFVAMFVGSLVAALLVFSGWPIVVAFVAYLFCGVTGLGLMAFSGYIRPVFSRGFVKVASAILRENRNTRKEIDFLKPQPVPDLSEYLFTTTRK